jgi:hypothetical protein
MGSFEWSMGFPKNLQRYQIPNKISRRDRGARRVWTRTRSFFNSFLGLRLWRTNTESLSSVLQAPAFRKQCN